MKDYTNVNETEVSILSLTLYFVFEIWNKYSSSFSSSNKNYYSMESKQLENLSFPC